jgi:hypothetical protein
MEIKRLITSWETVDHRKSDSAWSDLMLASAEISQRWEGPSVVEEIRQQRERG